MLQIIRLTLCILLLLISTTNSYAITLDRSHVTITNNTSDSVAVHTDLITSDDAFKKGDYWDETTIVLEPYQSKEVLWFSRNAGVKTNQDYQFTLTASNAAYSDDHVIINFHEKGNRVFGSEITSDLTLPLTPTQPILTQSGLNNIDAHFWNANYTVHTRKWRPMTNLFDDYQIVIDKPDTPSFPTPKNTQLSVLTYNTQLMPFYTGTVNDLNDPNLRSRDIPSRISQYDVVITQELFDRDLRAQFVNGMKNYYPYYTRVVGDNTSLPLTGGVMIFSKWPIEKEDQIIYYASTGIDKLAAKGVMYAMINKNGNLYHIFGTHALAGGSPEDIRARTNELEQFEDFINSMHIPANQPIIIGGDFNIDQYTDEVNILLSKLNVSLVDNIGYKYSTDALVDTMNNGHDRNRLDYVFYKNAHATSAYNKVYVLRALDDEKKWPKFDLSDHFPVAAYFEFS